MSDFLHFLLKQSLGHCIKLNKYKEERWNESSMRQISAMVSFVTEQVDTRRTGLTTRHTCVWWRLRMLSDNNPSLLRDEPRSM